MDEQLQETVMTPPDNVGTHVPDNRKERCFEILDAIEKIKLPLDSMRQNPVFMSVPECGANLTLAYRHLEDARMRIGKAIQSLDGGTSCYPR